MIKIRINEKEITEEEFVKLKEQYKKQGILLKEISPGNYRTLLRG